MAISYAASGQQMIQYYNADSTTGWGGANDGLEGNGAQIQGTDCIIAALRKNENVSITYASTVTPATGSQLFINFYTNIASLLNSLTVDINDGGSGTANYNILSEYDGTDGPRITTKGFVPLCFDMSAGSLNVTTNNLAGFDFNINVQNVNVKAADNQYWDAGYYGDGITLTGTTVSDTLFGEAQAYDVGAADLFIGVLQIFEDVIFAQHNVRINTTTGNSTGENLTFIQTNHGTNDYTLDGTGTAVFDGTNIQTTGTVTSTVDMSSMTAFTMTAGSMNNITTITFGSGQTINRANFNDITTFNTGSSTFTDNVLSTITTANISAAASGCTFNSVTTPNVTGALTNCAFNESGEVDISTGGGTLTSCSFTNTTAAIALTVADLNDIDDLTFTGDNTSHAVDLGTISTNTTRSWNHTVVSGYAATSQAQNASSTPGDSEVILVNVASGITLTISVDSGASSPTYRNIGPGTVEIQALANFDITNLREGTEIRLYKQTNPAALGLGGVEDVANSSSYDSGFSQIGGPPVNSDTFTDGSDKYAIRYQYNYADFGGTETPLFVIVQALGYQYLRIPFTINGTNQELLVSQVIDRNFSNPD